MKRSRSNDGHRTSLSRVLPIDAGLLAKLTAEFAEIRERAAPKTYHGPTAARGAPASTITDEQVLAIRRMSGWHGMTDADIAQATGLRQGTIYNLTSWKNRVHLDPGPKPEPTKEAE